MRWLEISVQCDGEAAEAVSDLFNRFNRGQNAQGGGQAGAVVEVTGFDAAGRSPQPVVTVRTYLPLDDEKTARRRRQIEEGLWFLGRLYPIPDPVIRELAEQDWATAWRAHYQPIPVGQRLLIVPAWLADEAEAWSATSPDRPRLPIVIDPGMAFGTGMHPSTRLCLALLERYVCPGDAVLDIGCGSGILSIAAARLGATNVLATDTDPVAVAATIENCRRNGVEAVVETQHGSLPAPDEWPVIVVNILAEVIVQLLDEGLAQLLADGGHLLLGGIIRDHASDVLDALDRYGLRVIEQSDEEEWIALVAM